MRARALGGGGATAARPAAAALRRPKASALVFLRGHDADARLRELVAARARVRPVLGELAAALLARSAHEALGFRSQGDFARERLGLGARVLREWARVARALAGLPALRRAVLSGEVSWSAARRVVGKLSAETEAEAVGWLRGRTVRAVEAILSAHAAASGLGEGEAAAGAEGEEEERVRVSLRAPPALEARWAAACELARRIAGEELPDWECAEAIAAECASAVGGAALSEADGAGADGGQERRRAKAHAPEPGLCHAAFPHLRWGPLAAPPCPELERLREGLEEAAPRQLDRRLRAAIGFLQAVDFELGRILRQVVDRRLASELGFESFERYVEERLDLSARTARRLVRLARAEHRAPAVANAFREGRITLLQAESLLRSGEDVERAERVTLRRLREAEPARVDFTAPPSVARLFLAMLVRMGGLEAMLEHAIATWLEAGDQFEDYADFERDGFRCTVPACSARRNLQSHHLHFRSAGGADEPWNRTTLCAFHHHRGLHAREIRIRGRAPDELVYELGFGTFRSGDLRIT
jgi:hypothetical protein